MKTYYKLALILSFIYLQNLSFVSAQISCEFPPNTLWDRTLGGLWDDEPQSILRTPDGGFLIGGRSSSQATADKSEASRGSYDYWIIKIDEHGQKEWDKTYGGTAGDHLTCMLLLPDGGYLLGGYSFSPTSYEKSEFRRGQADYWVIRTDDEGNLLWDRTYGGYGLERLNTMVLLSDGNILLGGNSDSGTQYEHSHFNRGNDDWWLVKINIFGNKLWDKAYGGTAYDNLEKIIPLSDGGFMLGGISASGKQYEKSSQGYGFSDYWILRTDSFGNKLWDRTFGTEQPDEFKDIIELPDGGFLLGGNTHAGISGVKTEPGRGIKDQWLIRTDFNGNLLWDKTIGGNKNDGVEKILLLEDGNYLIAGESDSNISGEKSQGNRGRIDYWLVKINPQAKILWDKVYGGHDDDRLQDAIEIESGEYIFTGRSISRNVVDKTEDRKGGPDFWTIRVTENLPLTLKAYLVNAETDEIIQEIKADDQIMLSPEEDELSIIVEAESGDIGSMQIILDGAYQQQKGESIPPYTLFGKTNNNTNILGVYLPDGGYELLATPYCKNGLGGEAGEALNLNFSITRPGPSPVTQFVLVDADTEQDIQVLQEGDVIDIDAIGNDRFSIRAEIGGRKIGSVLMELSSDALNHTQTENLPPYALFGGEPATNYYGQRFPLGDYTIKATPYLGRHLTDEAGLALEINFKVDDLGYLDDLNITKLILVDAGTNQDIRELSENDRFERTQDALSMRAEAGTLARCVKFEMFRASDRKLLLRRYENIEPYSLKGDDPRGDYREYFFSYDAYILEVTPYSESFGRGLEGVTKVYHFGVTEVYHFDISNPAITPNQNLNDRQMELYPNPTSSSNIRLTIQDSDCESTRGKYIIYNNQGFVKLEGDFQDGDNSLNISGLDSGLYIIQVQTPCGVYQSTLMKN